MYQEVESGKQEVCQNLKEWALNVLLPEHVSKQQTGGTIRDH